MEVAFVVVGLIVIVIALIWAIRQGPPDDGIGPPPTGGNYWLAGG